MVIQTLAELFDYELQAAYFMETELVGALDEMARETQHDEMSRAFANHRDETREHVERLEEVFEARGLAPEMAESHAVVGLIQDHRNAAGQINDADVQDLYNVGAGMKVERTEITAYDNLITLAKKLDLDDEVIEPLDDIRDEEEDTFKRLQRMSQGSQLRSLVDRLL